MNRVLGRGQGHSARFAGGVQSKVGMGATVLGLIVVIGSVLVGCQSASSAEDDLVGDWLVTAIRRNPLEFQSCPATNIHLSCGSYDMLRLRPNGSYVATDGDFYPSSGTWWRGQTQLMFRGKSGEELQFNMVINDDILELSRSIRGDTYTERLRRF